jgi:acyl-CoA thioester hydrolase
MGLEYRHRMRVRFRECDMQGHVFFAEYPALLDVAITEMWREHAGTWQTMVEGGHDMVVAGLEVQYRGSAQFDDEIDFVIRIGRVGDTSLSASWQVERGAEVLVTGTIRYVCIDPVSHAKKPVPEALREAFA